MRSPEMSNQPTMHWVQVVDARGRAHLEAHWELPAPASAPIAAATTVASPAAHLTPHAA